ncbi:MAG: transglycosylase SLT domain-containing protein, partial [Pseudomonadota bacterium]
MRLNLTSLACSLFLLATCCAERVSADPDYGGAANLGSKARARGDAFGGPFKPSPELRARVDFWKDIFSRYGAGHSVIHHRDFPQITFGVIDLEREKASMSDVAFDAYKTSVVKRTVDDVKAQMLELAAGGDARTPFQERLVEQLEERRLPVYVLKNWVDQDLIRTQTGIKERYAEAIRRAWRYIPVMEQIFTQEFGLPKELTRIPFIESSFDYTAYSSVGAAGIWQFMPRTARAHRMVVGRHVDDRRDPIKATRAAAEYLRSAYNSLGSWPLAITSYNHGVGGVRSKVRKAGTDDLVKIIEDPRERYFGFASTNFYPEFLAAVEIFEDPQGYFPEVRPQPPLRVASYPIRRASSASTVAAQLGISVEDLREANYGLLDTVWRGQAAIPTGYTLRVPVSHKERAERGVGSGGSIERSGAGVEQVIVPVAVADSGSTYTVKRGDTLASVAARFNVDQVDLIRVNGLESGQLRPGQTLRLQGEGVEQPSVSRARDLYQRVSVPQAAKKSAKGAGKAPTKSASKTVVARPGDT